MNPTRVDPLALDRIAFVLILLVLPIDSNGALERIDAVWGSGLVLLLVGGLVPLVTEFALREDENED